jgi:hypothetical protein
MRAGKFIDTFFCSKKFQLKLFKKNAACISIMGVWTLPIFQQKHKISSNHVK